MPAVCINSACYGSLEEAIDASAPRDILVLSPGTHVAAAGIDHDLTLLASSNGPVYVRDTLDGSPILLVEGGAHVTVYNVALTATGGRVFELGPAAHVNFFNCRLASEAFVDRGGIGLSIGGTIELGSTLLIGGTAEDGGQLYVQDGALLIGSATLQGGVAFGRGGAIALIDADGVPDDYQFSGVVEDAEAGVGGCLFVLGESLDVWGAWLDGCHASALGGAITATDADLTVDQTSIVDTDAGGGAAVHALGLTRPVSLAVTDTRIVGTTGAAIYGERLARMDVDRVEILTVDGSGPSTLSRADGLAVSAAGVGLATIRRTRTCDVRGPDRPVFGASLSPGAQLSLQNNRFTFTAIGDPVVHVAADGGTVLVEHNDFLENARAALDVDGDPDVLRVEGNLVAGTDAAGPLLALGAPTLLSTSRNLFWDNGRAALADRDVDAGVVGDPRIHGLTEAGCAFVWNGTPWSVDDAPYARWASAGRDLDANATDPDGTPADAGAGGGPHAYPELWSDFDADGYPVLYDCVGNDGIDEDPARNPSALEIAYDGVDGDCDAWSDWDADLDGHAAEAFEGDDCDDTDPAVHPGAQEVGETPWDDDCDGNNDGDGDGFLPGTGPAADCDDTDPTVFPGRTEDADPVDRNCDGVGDVAAPLVPGCAHASPRGGVGLALALGLLRRRRRVSSRPEAP